MNEEFLNIIEQYKTNKDLIDKIRIYILNHLYTNDDITQYITLFGDTAKLIGDDVGYALSRGMLFRYIMGVILNLLINIIGNL